MNRAALDADAVRDSLAKGYDQMSGHMIGMSTGTSGNRGYYVITARERFVWLGTILAKTVPDALWRSHRVALAFRHFPGSINPHSLAAGSICSSSTLRRDRVRDRRLD